MDLKNKKPLNKEILKALREQIDNIDAEVLKLLQKRLKIVREIGFIKKQINLPITNAQREYEIYQRLKHLNKNSKNPLPESDMIAFWENLINFSTQIQLDDQLH